MTDNQFISVRESAQLLGVTEKKVMELIEDKDLVAYKIANQFLRLKKSEVLALRKTGSIHAEITEFAYTFPERVRDFFYFNDFYLISLVIIAILLYIIFYG